MLVGWADSMDDIDLSSEVFEADSPSGLYSFEFSCIVFPVFSSFFLLFRQPLRVMNFVTRVLAIAELFGINSPRGNPGSGDDSSFNLFGWIESV
jgi:hypothetical protein